MYLPITFGDFLPILLFLIPFLSGPLIAFVKYLTAPTLFGYTHLNGNVRLTLTFWPNWLQDQ